MKTILIIAFAIVSFITLTALTSMGYKDEILNGFANNKQAVPEWVEVEWSNDHNTGSTHQITYGVGGRTCHSIVKFDLNNNMKEIAKRCEV